MGDLFHESVTEYQWIAVFDIIRRSIYNGGGPGHTFLILTKRPHTMQLVMKNLKFNGERLNFNNKGIPFINLCGDGVWLGISAENQQTADERIPILLQIPAAKRFVSLEPMLGPVELDKTCHGNRIDNGWCWRSDLDWVIVGGLSLPGGKIQAPKRDWLDSIVEQCSDAGVACFLKDNAQYPIERKEFPR